MESTMKEVLDSHKAFWNMEDVNQPLIMMVPFQDCAFLSKEGPPMKLRLSDGSVATEGLHLKPQMISPKEIPTSLLTTWGGMWGIPTKYEVCGENNGLPCMIGDIFCPIAPYSKIPWMEAIAGCSIPIAVKANTIWAEPIATDYVREIEVREDWVERLESFTRFLADNFSRQYMLSCTLMRGPIDILSALLGQKNLVINIYRKDSETKKTLSDLADLYIRVAQAQLEKIPAFHGGYCNWTGLWSPGTSVRTTTHEAGILPSELCKEFVLPFDEKISRSFDYSMTEIHSNYLRVVNMFLESKSVKSISVAFDRPPFGPPLGNLLPVMSRIQRTKPLEIIGEFTRKELDKIVKTLQPKGLTVKASLRPN